MLTTIMFLIRLSLVRKYLKHRWEHVLASELIKVSWLKPELWLSSTWWLFTLS